MLIVSILPTVMLKHFLFSLVLCHFTSAATAPHAHQDAISKHQRISPPNYTVDVLYQFPYDERPENIAQRTNGNLLVTLSDRSELYEINPQKPGSIQLVHNFTGASFLTGIVEFENNRFAVAVNGNSVWEVNLNSNLTATASLMVEIPNAGFLNGIARLGHRSSFVVVADSSKGLVWRVDMHSGNYSVALQDDTMAPEDVFGLALGINGIRLLDDYLYFSNTPKHLFCRVRIDLSTGLAKGPYEAVAREALADDFTLSPFGTAYLASSFENTITEVLPNGQHTALAGSLNSTTIPGPTSILLDPSKSPVETFFITTNGAELSPVNGTFSVGGQVLVLRRGHL